jgi:purine-binding chemotaxis protein CheW
MRHRPVSESPDRLPERLAELRRTFDRSFAVLPPPLSDTDNLLAIRVAGDPHAIRLTEVSALFADHTTTALPCSLPELRGVAGFRGAIVAVYDLATLLGYPWSAAPRWLLLTAGTPAVALAFDTLDGHLRVASDAMAAVDAAVAADHGRRAYVGQVVRTPEGVWSVLDLPAIRAAIAARSRPADPTGKR